MRCLFALLLALSVLISCRSTQESAKAVSNSRPAMAPSKVVPLALGEGFACAISKKGQGQCLGQAGKGGEGPDGWQSLRAVGNTPFLRLLTARSTVSCALGLKPAPLENRILCWQPQTARAPLRTDQEAILMSGKMPGSIRSLALQKDRVCALGMDGQVACAPFASQEALSFTSIKGLRSIRLLRSGEGFSCGLRGDSGAIFCWGDNSHGQLGLGSRLRSDDEPVAIAGFSGFATLVETGARHVCAINSAGEVQCWGDNSDQQLGIDSAAQAEPVVVRGLPAKAEALALGARHSCAQLVDGSVWCWGAREFLGSESQGGLIPVRVPLPVTAASVVAASDRTCALLTTGEVFCWGMEPEIFAGLP